MRFLIILIIIFQILVSCKNKEEKNLENSLFNKVQKVEIRDSEFLEFIKDLEVKKNPFQENLNFEDFDKYKNFTENEVKVLSLNRINENLISPKIRYRINLSNNFYSIVISYLKNEQELNTEIINYTKEGKLIDHFLIGYDEIAESLLYTNSDIYKDKLVINNSQYFEEGDEAIVNTNEVKINTDGTFTLINEN